MAYISVETPGYLAFPRNVLDEELIFAEGELYDFPTPRSTILEVLFEQLTADLPVSDHQARATAVAAWVQWYFVHPMHTPLRPDGIGVFDPIQLLDLRRAQCGQVNRLMLDILDAGGYRGRVVQLGAHQGAELFYDGSWHYIEADALAGGAQIVKPDGTLPSAMEIHQSPQWLDGVCLSCENHLVYLSAEQRARTSTAMDFALNGDGWRRVFSVEPDYYERIVTAAERRGDPQYGWMGYIHHRDHERLPAIP